MTIHLEQPLSRYTVIADNRPGNSVARPSVVAVDVVVVEKEHITISLEGCTKRSGLNRGRSPRYVGAKRLPVRQYLALSVDTARHRHFFTLSLFYAAATYGILIVICKVNVFLPIPTYQPR